LEIIKIVDIFLITQTPNDGKTWLTEKNRQLQIEQERHVKNTKAVQWKNEKNEDFKLKDLNKDQFHIAYYILKKVQEWLNLPNKSKKECRKFKPLRMTVLGQGGTGKSRLINTLVSVIRKMFQSNNSVHVAAPTGAAAHAVNGQTIHRIFSVNTEKRPN
jgi:hypothetical protein